METTVKFELPLKRLPQTDPKWRKMLPRSIRWFGWLFVRTRFSIGEFGSSGKTNHTYQFWVFRWLVLTVHRNEYHDQSDKERADEYLRKWSECEKELRGMRLLVLGDVTPAEIKKLIKDSLGVDLDEGTIQ